MCNDNLNFKNINWYVDKAHSQAIKSGWWENPRSSLEIYALIHSEISEGVEEVRKGTDPIYYEGPKPQGELIELADAVVRIMDYCGYKGWDLESAIKLKMDYNETRPYRHGKKL